MDVVETEWWTMALAPEWWADVEEDGTVLVADEDDVGCLEMTTLHKADSGNRIAFGACLEGRKLRRLPRLHGELFRGGGCGARVVPGVRGPSAICQLQL